MNPLEKWEPFFFAPSNWLSLDFILLLKDRIEFTDFYYQNHHLT